MTATDKKVIFFGCPLDCDEREESVREKLACMGPGHEDDPYAFVMAYIRDEVDTALWEEIGSLDVPAWLRPVPPVEHRPDMHVGAFVDFIDQDGCRTFADMIGEHVVRQIYPNIPCMVAVDHALTGGVFRELSRLYAPDELSLIVLDSHTDAVPVSVSAGAIKYDMETNPASLYDREDPFLANRRDSFNASSFLFHMLDEGVVEPQNLILMGVSDYPGKKDFRQKDPRIRRYTRAFSSLKERGVTLIRKDDLQKNVSRVKALLRNIDTPYVYISVDMDVGANRALDGVRFLNRQGLSENKLSTILHLLWEMLAGDVALAGLDITEINARTAGPGPAGAHDRTYRIAADLIKKLCFTQ